MGWSSGVSRMARRTASESSMLMLLDTGTPKKLTKEQRRLVEQLAKELPQEKFRPRPREDEQDERNLFDRVKDMFG